MQSFEHELEALVDRAVAQKIAYSEMISVLEMKIMSLREQQIASEEEPE